MNKAANRLSLTLLITALLIASSILVLAKVPPFIGDIPLLGFVGYVLAMVLGLLLAISILFRSR